MNLYFTILKIFLIICELGYNLNNHTNFLGSKYLPNFKILINNSVTKN